MNNSEAGTSPQLVMEGGDEHTDGSLQESGSPPSILAIAQLANMAARTGKGADNAADIEWSDSRPFIEQVTAYPATCLLVTIFILVFAVMWKKRISPAALGSSYRQVVIRFELWRSLTAAVVHGGVLHLLFSVIAVWRCRRMEAELGSWNYLVASVQLLLVAESCEKALQHAIYRAGSLSEVTTIGYSAVAFAWMVVISLKSDMPVRTIGGVKISGVTDVMFNILVMRIFVRRSSVVADLAGSWAGLLFAAGGLDFARTRYWGLGLAAWILTVLLGSLKATTAIPIPLLDYVDFSGRSELGIRVISFDWSNRENWADYATSNA